MISAGLSAARFVAFPIEPVFERGAFAGFTMPFAPNRKPVHEAYSPASRRQEFPRANFAFLLRVASNIASSVASVHERGCVIGDVNHSGLLVAADATVTLIDTDSFQFSSSQKLFPCEVGVEEFTPPELQGRSLAGILRTKNHDNFGLAVLIFYLLFMGRHPFAGQPVGNATPPTMQEAIKNFRFAYSSRHNETRLAPPPHTATLADVPQEVRDAFELAFGPTGSTSGRPLASDWMRILVNCEKALVSCNQSPSHQYFAQAKNCPWCRMERAVPGFFAFPVLVNTGVSDQAVSLKVLLAKFNAIKHPPPTPALDALMPALNLTPSVSVTEEFQRQKQLSSIGFFVAIAGALTLGALPSNWSLVGLTTIIVGAVLYFITAKTAPKLSAIENRCSAAWASTKKNWENQNSTRSYDMLLSQARDKARDAEKIEGDEKIKLDALYAERQKNQLRAFLATYRIDKAKIGGIGPSRTVILRSYGIETAADVELNRVRYIKGFGPKTAQTMVNWRRSIENKFVFDPKSGVNPADIAAVRAEFSRKRADAIGKLGSYVAHIETERVRLDASRTTIGPDVMETWKAYQQSVLDVAEAKRLAPTTSSGKFVGLAGLAFALSSTFFQSREIASTARTPSLTTAPITQQTPQPTKAPGNTTQPSGGLPSVAASRPLTGVIQELPARITIPPEPGPIAATAPPLIPTAPPVAALPHELPALPPLPVTEIKSAAPSIDLSKSEDVLKVQVRLNELGFLKAKPNGKFGPMSKQALMTFQSTVGIADTNSIDPSTYRFLFAPDAPKRTQSTDAVPDALRGDWSQDQCDMPTNRPPVVFDATSASVYGSTCKFEQFSSAPGIWNTKAVCTDPDGKARTSDISFSLSGNVLTWAGTGGRIRYYRCR